MKDHVLNKKVLLVAGCISVSACLQVFPDYFIYWRESLLGEFWRLWTAHWVHVGWIHFLLNISLVFYFYLPNIDAYAGLSGVLHGLYTAVALVYLQYRKERNFAFLVLGLIVAKLIWENTFGQTGTAQLIGSPVLTEAHLYGAIGGAIFGGCYWLIQRFK